MYAVFHTNYRSCTKQQYDLRSPESAHYTTHAREQKSRSLGISTSREQRVSKVRGTSNRIGRRGREISSNISVAVRGRDGSRGREKSRRTKEAGSRQRRRVTARTTKKEKGEKADEREEVSRRGGRGWVWCSRGRKWRGVLMRFRYRPGHLVSRLPAPVSPPPRHPRATLHPRNGPPPARLVDSSRSGGHGWRKRGLSRESEEGSPLVRVGWLLAEWADMYAVAAHTAATLSPSWNRCRSSGRKELLRSSGAPGVHRPSPSTCVRADTHIFHPRKPSPTRDLLFLFPHVDGSDGCVRHVRRRPLRGFLLLSSKKWRLRCDTVFPGYSDLKMWL